MSIYPHPPTRQSAKVAQVRHDCRGALAGWVGGLTQVPLISGFAMGANEGVDSAKELDLETPEEQLAMGLLFGGVEMVTERLGGIGNQAATDALLAGVRT